MMDGFDPGIHSTISSPAQKGCLIAEGFHLLHFPLDEFYVRVFTETYMYVDQAH